MTRNSRRVVIVVGALAAVLVTLAGVLLLWPEDKPADATPPPVPSLPTGPSADTVTDSFARALSAGAAAEAAGYTDNPAAAEAAVAVLAKNVPAGMLKFTRARSAQQAGALMQTSLKAVLTVSSANQWTTTLALVNAGGTWKVRWAPTVIHPNLAEGQSIAVIGQVGEPGKVAAVGDDGRPIANWDAAGATPVDPNISPLLMQSLVGGTTAPGATDTRHVSIVDAAGKEIGEPLFGTRSTPAPIEPIKTTLNAKIAISAQNAVAKAPQPTMLVAIRASTGGILAVAQNAAAGTSPTALNGQYPPGSSFKIVTAAAAIQQQGLNPESSVACPGQATVGGRQLRNNNSFDLGTTKLRTAFAKSCNTTFGDIAAKLPADGLRRAADQFGLNADFTVPGIKTEMGRVDDAVSSVQRVEDSIGQGNVKASPLGMALVAATVVARKPVTPQLLVDDKTNVGKGYSAPPPAVLGQIQTMMRDVVTSGTATGLARFAGAAGKTGTAETENQGDNAHGWFVGYRGDVAFAVLVVDGHSSGVAVNVAAAFLSGF